MPAYLEEPDLALPDAGTQPLNNNVRFIYIKRSEIIA